MNVKEKFKAYVDLTRAHFIPVWPIVFCSGLLLAFQNYNYFSWSLLIRAIIIGTFGFEAGMVLNDIVDRNLDKLDTDDKNLNKYWRPFNQRPIPSGKVSIKEAYVIFGLFVAISALFIATLSFPHNIYVYIIMVYGYAMEIFYQIKKRDQRYPIAQLLGRTDLTLFPVAGYLCLGNPDLTVLFLILFMYPWAIAHLGVNDIIDVKNDHAKGLNTVTELYGIKGNILWINIFTGIHLIMAIFLLIFELSFIALSGFIIAFLILITANILLIRNKTSLGGLKILPMFHMSLLIYMISIILDSILII
ncbi:MAG: prenyltransferase [Promethearchaeota archaeon]|nr:MAG: prenyltransferase [Candidatus Lokiarchaeota archaeon]